ncbi:MAG: hypothetical protein JO120_10460 [Solirubrobacterales bacterium]|nr:hypothetical protein [Solirubrobacterales bacterium]
MRVYGSIRTGLRAITLTVVALAALAGCGLEHAAPGTAVTITVTRDFGAATMGSAVISHPPGGTTALGMLQRRFQVRVGAGSSVRAVGGVAAGATGRWALYINGVASRARARVHPGDRLWWDLQDSGVRPLAAVGSFPEPFVHGIGGRRYPSTLECAGDVAAACRHLAAVLTRAGVPISSQAPGTGSGQDSITLVVGTWHEIRAELVATLLESGPRTSGVFARFEGGSLQLLGGHGQVVSTLGPGAGLIAAVAANSAPPTWLVVGATERGVAAAARAFSASRLRDHFALAVSGDHALPVPQ